MSSRAERTAAPFAVLILLSFVPVAAALVRGEVLIFRDHFDYFLPLREFTAEALRSGELPFWNPYNGSGERWLANPQTGVFYPPAWLFVALPLPLASNLFLAFHLALLGCGAFALFRRIASAESALFAAVTLMLCGPTLSLLDVSNNLASFAWLPLVICAALAPPRLDRDSLLLALMFLGGEPLLAAVGALVFAIVVMTGAKRDLRRVIGTAAVTILLVLPQLAPFIGLLQGSDRAAGLEPELALRNSMALRDWLTMLLPTPAATGRTQTFIAVTFVPLVVLITAAGAFGAHASREKRLYSWIAATAFVAATLPAFAFVGDLLRESFVTVARYPARFVPFVVFGLCGLAAIGGDVVRRDQRLRTRFAVAVSVLLVLALTTTSDTRALSLALLNVAIAVIFIFAERRLAYAVALTAIPLLAWSVAAPLRVSAPPEMLRSPWARVISDEFKVARAITPAPDGWPALRRVYLMSGYRNLIEKKFDVSSPAPVVDREYLRIHDLAVLTPRLDLLSLLNVGFIIAERPLRGFEEVRGGRPFVYRNSRALPAAALWRSDRPSHSPAAGKAITRFDGLGRVEIDVTAPALATLVLSQTDAPGWSVEVDGKAAQKRRVHGVFRGVDVPPGRHQVVWRYREPWFTPSLLTSLVTLSFLVAYAARRANSSREISSST